MAMLGEPLRDRLVVVHPLAAQQVRVGDVAYQRLLEDVLGVPMNHRLAALEHELAPLQLIEVMV